MRLVALLTSLRRTNSHIASKLDTMGCKALEERGRGGRGVYNNYY